MRKLSYIKIFTKYRVNISGFGYFLEKGVCLLDNENKVKLIDGIIEEDSFLEAGKNANYTFFPYTSINFVHIDVEETKKRARNLFRLKRMAEKCWPVDVEGG